VVVESSDKHTSWEQIAQNILMGRKRVDDIWFAIGRQKGEQKRDSWDV